MSCISSINLFPHTQASLFFLIESHLPDSSMQQNSLGMADLPGYVQSCFNTGRIAFLAILVSGGIVLQILACALYNNWWPLLTVLMYVLLPMPLLFIAGSDSSSLFSESKDSWLDATKFLTGATTVGSIAIPAILKHAGIISLGAMIMELSSFLVLVSAILCYMVMSNDDYDYWML